MTKIIIIIMFFFWIYGLNYIQAENIKKQEEIKKEKERQKRELQIKKLDNKLEILFKKYEKKSNIEQKEFYWKVLKSLSFYKKKYKDSNKMFLINIIINKFEEKYDSIKINKINFYKSKTLILKFTNNITSNNSIIEKNKKNIQDNISVFIFRNSVNLQNSVIKNISKKIKTINPKILLFIDQEWWLINRYIDFESTESINKFFIKKNNKYSFLQNNLNKLNDKQIKIIRNIFPTKYWYFPSLETIWKTYDKFEKKENAKIFLEIIAFIRLQSLKESWINTYWIVLDLNRWNPVISWNKRSFSKHLWKYKILVDAFLKAWKNTEILLYAKHFPWHWTWKIDSHKWILNLKNESKYLKENLELFDYFLNNSWKLQVWLMVWHIYISSDLQILFESIVKKADFILTDDLAMLWYKKAKWKKIKGLFFSTDSIINNKKIIIVDTLNISKIK